MGRLLPHGRHGDPTGVPADAATIGFGNDPDWTLVDGEWRRDVDDDNCLHDALEESRPPTRKGDPHNLACNCPRCSPTMGVHQHTGWR